MLGIETEYGLAVTGRGASGLDRGRFVRNLISLAMQRFPFLPASGGNGLFLGNGSRFYIDSGGHPELCTPEVDNPWDVVRYVEAGEALLQELAGALTTGGSGAEVVLFSAFPPNPKWKFGSHRMADYASATERVAREVSCAYADVFGNWQALAARKKPEDLLGNNINHPNDFGHWIYYRVLSALGL